MNNDNKVVLVVGAGRGRNIGYFTAQKFAAEGWAVVVADKLKQVDAFLFGSYRCCDVTIESQIEKLLLDIKEAFGRLDAIINSAGVNLLGPIESYYLEDFENTIAVNLTSNFLLLKHYVRIFDNDNKDKVFLAITSDTAEIPKTSTFAYGASKAGANHFLRCAARELNKYHRDNWVVTGLAIGMVEGTPMDTKTVADLMLQRGITEEAARGMLTVNIPVGRGLTMAEVAEWVYFITTKGQYATGNIIRVDAGQCQG